MKKNNKLLTITAAFIAATFGGCVGTQNVYGPPVDPGEPAPQIKSEDIEDPSDETSMEREEVQDVYGPPVEEWDDIEAVYGPPIDEMEESEIDSIETEVTEEDILEEIRVQRPTVYGPPADMIEPEVQEVQDVYGPPLEFDR